VHHGSRVTGALQGHAGATYDTPSLDTAMTDYDMHDLMRNQLAAIYVDLTAMGLMPEQYDQRLTPALQHLRNARALLEECRG
jgi:hypothetical protein